MSKSFVKKLVQTWSSWNYLEQSLACESLNACNINLNLKENLAFKKCVKKSFMSLPEEIIVSKDSALLLSFSKGLLILTKESSTYYCITWGDSSPPLQTISLQEKSVFANFAAQTNFEGRKRIEHQVGQF